MQNLEWTTIDKSTWPRGQWDNEPDKMQYTDSTTGLPCLIVRNHFGALCGYVGVDETHPWYRKGYSDLDNNIEPNVHGGLTFADKCAENETDPSKGICHLTEDGKAVWWFGFDCAHAIDYCPGLDQRFNFEAPDRYKNLAYVKEQIAGLALQIQEVVSLKV